MTTRFPIAGRPVRRWGLAAFIAAAPLATGCLDPTGETTLVGELRVRPVYAAGMEPSALRIELDSVWAVVTRAGPDEVVVDRVRPTAGDDGELRWVIDLARTEETLRVSLELRSGTAPMYAGATSATVSEGPIGQADLHDIPVAYVGPTPRAASIEVIPSRLAMPAVGRQRTVRAVVLDQAADTVFRPVTWTAEDPGVATVDGAGRVTAVSEGSTHVIAAIDGRADSAVVVVDSGIARTTSVTADSASMVADGVSSTTVRVEVRDGAGNRVGSSAGPVTLTSTLGSVAPVPAIDHGDGTYTATLTAGTATGAAVVSGTLDGVAIRDTAGVTFRPGPGDPTTTTITADSASLVAANPATAAPGDETLTLTSVVVSQGPSSTLVTVRVLDAHGNPVGSSAGTVVLATTLGTLGDVTDQQDGTYTATLTAGAEIGEAVVTGTLDGVAIADTVVVEIRPLADP